MTRYNLKKSNTTTFNLPVFLDNCQRHELFKRKIDKVYEIIVYSFFETLINHLNTQIRTEFDRDAIQLIKDIGIAQNLFFNLDKKTVQLLPADNSCLGSGTRKKNKILQLRGGRYENIKVKYISLDTHIIPATTCNVLNEQILIVCKDSEKSKIRNIISHLGLLWNISTFISECTLIEWYHKCFTPKYIDSIGTALIKKFNVKFKKVFPLTPSFSIMTN
jgi:hypothetical protein